MERRPAIAAAVERAVLARQLYCCNVCHKPLHALYDIDHAIPRCFLPRDDAGALQALCVECHAAKTRLDEPRLIVAHKHPDTKVCWAGCKRVVATSAYNDELLACDRCAPGFIERQRRQQHELRQREEQQQRQVEALGATGALDAFRYTPSPVVAAAVTSKYFR